MCANILNKNNKKTMLSNLRKVIKKLFSLNKQIISCLKEKIFKVILKGD